MQPNHQNPSTSTTGEPATTGDITNPLKVTFGLQPRTVEQWLELFITSNEKSAQETIWPCNKRVYRAHVWAFKEVIRLLHTAQLEADFALDIKTKAAIPPKVSAAVEILSIGLKTYAEDADPGDLSRQAHKAKDILEGK